MMSFDTSLVRYTETQSQQFFEQVAERARAVPGVKTRDDDDGVPMSNDSIRTVTIAPEGFQFPAGKENVTVLASVRGRTLLRHDGDRDCSRDAISASTTMRSAPRVAIVNQHLAQHYWPNQDLIGKRFRLDDADKTWVEIVGVVKTSKYIFIAEPPSDFVYLPYRQRKPSGCS